MGAIAEIDIAGILIATSPFVMVVCIVLIVNFTNYHLRRLKSRERLAAIEKGLPIPDYPPDPRRNAAKTRRSAIVLIATGVGIGAAFACLSWVQQERHVLAISAFAIIPLVIGIGLLIDYRLQVRRLEDKAQGETRPADPPNAV